MTYTKELERELIDFRLDLHEHPELSNQEYRTTEKIKNALEEEGIEVLDLPLKTGLVARIQGAHPGPTIALRADIDALPIEEQADVIIKSSITGVMHACGHDFHTASLLGSAILLKNEKDKLAGTIILIFQSAEETGVGSKKVLDTGILEGVQAIFGFHNDPSLPLGTLGTRAGSLTSGVDRFEIEVSGVGAHAAKPNEGNDPLIIATQIVQQFQSIISRNTLPSSHSVLSVTQLSSGDTWNVIPQSAFLQGTVRTFDPAERITIERRIRQVLEGLELSFDCRIKLDWIPSAPSVINTETWVPVAFKIAEQVGLNPVEIPETPIGEDFGYYLRDIPGIFVMLGTGTDYPLHHPKFRIDDRALEKIVLYYVELTKSILAIDKLD